MLKNAYFLEKKLSKSSQHPSVGNCQNRPSVENCQNRPSVGGFEPPFASGGWGSALTLPVLLLPPTITVLLSSFLSLNTFYYPQKGTK